MIVLFVHCKQLKDFALGV